MGVNQGKVVIERKSDGRVRLHCTGDATTGAVFYVINPADGIDGMSVRRVRTYPNTIDAPGSTYNVEINDADGWNLLRDLVNSRSTSAPEEEPVYDDPGTGSATQLTTNRADGVSLAGAKTIELSSGLGVAKRTMVELIP